MDTPAGTLLGAPPPPRGRVPPAVPPGSPTMSAQTILSRGWDREGRGPLPLRESPHYRSTVNARAASTGTATPMDRNAQSAGTRGFFVTKTWVCRPYPRQSMAV